MSDSLRSARGQQPARGSWRNLSIRNSANYDDFLHPSNAAGSVRHSLRPADSRYSLHEQFAATRREYEFGFDDAASSIWERASTVASVVDEEEGDDTVKLGFNLVPGVVPEDGAWVRRDFYDLLCLPRDGTATQEQIRGAFLRLFRLLDAEGAPENVRATARRYFQEVYAAFETLIGPETRAAYDGVVDDDGLSVAEEDDVRESEESGANGDRGVPIPLLRQLQYQPTADLGIRTLGPDALFWPFSGRQMRLENIRPLDFAVGHTMHVGLPRLGQLTQDGINTSRRYTERWRKRTGKSPLFDVPTLSVSASSYGLLGDPSILPSRLLSDRYQPLLPETLPRSRLVPLAQGRPSPLVTAKYRQEVFWREQTAKSVKMGLEESALPDSVIEIEADVIHNPSITARFCETIPIEGEEEPLHFEVMANTGSLQRRDVPRLGLALHRRIAGRTVFLCVDSGTWSTHTTEAVSKEKECGYFDRFFRKEKKKKQRRMPFGLPLPIAPTAEIGCSFGPGSEMMGLAAGQSLTRPADRGLKGVDMDLDIDQLHHGNNRNRGSWTISAAATSTAALASYLRYSQDVSNFVEDHMQPGTVRLEAELAATTTPSFGHFSQYIALRCLRRFSLAKLGYEIALSPHAIHISLYVSRAGWRLKLPFLVAGGSGPVIASHKLYFWATAAPFIVLAAMDWVRGSDSTAASSSSQLQKQRRRDLSREDLQEYVAVRRAEADRLVEVLTWGTEARQRAERARKGLVILSAKYGVRAPGEAGAWAEGEEVADVTAAVAALVDEKGMLLIPAGARKSRLLGFWDPAPLRTKMLVVRYLYRGKEAVAEVRGRVELCLPPVQA